MSENDHLQSVERRRFLKHLATAAAIGGGAALLQTPPNALAGGNFPHINVKVDYGAVGNGVANDTTAFQNALNAAGNAGGGIVFAPRGNYRINGTLSIPAHVTLEGVFTAPTAWSQNYGTTLLAYSGRNNPNGTPFITLNGSNSGIKGLTIYYPEQNNPSSIVPYAWTIRGGSSATWWDNLTIQDVLLVNPYQAIDFGTYACGRHLIRGVYGQPLSVGIVVDQSLDVGRIEDVHFGFPFWSTQAITYTANPSGNGRALVLKRSDGQMVHNFFAFGYHVGVQFLKGSTTPPDGSALRGTWGVITNLVLDAVNVGIDIYSIAPEGVQISNLKVSPVTTYGQTIRKAIYSHVDYSDTIGPLSVVNAAFFGNYATEAIRWEKGGPLQVSSCVFMGWGGGQPAITLGGSVSAGVRAVIHGNHFQDATGKAVKIESTVNDRVIISDNLLVGNSLDPSTTSGYPFRIYADNMM